jgi:hypothetical protein
MAATLYRKPAELAGSKTSEFKRRARLRRAYGKDGYLPLAVALKLNISQSLKALSSQLLGSVLDCSSGTEVKRIAVKSVTISTISRQIFMFSPRPAAFTPRPHPQRGKSAGFGRNVKSKHR